MPKSSLVRRNLLTALGLTELNLHGLIEKWRITTVVGKWEGGGGKRECKRN